MNFKILFLLFLPFVVFSQSDDVIRYDKEFNDYFQGDFPIIKYRGVEYIGVDRDNALAIKKELERSKLKTVEINGLYKKDSINSVMLLQQFNLTQIQSRSLSNMDETLRLLEYNSNVNMKRVIENNSRAIDGIGKKNDVLVDCESRLKNQRNLSKGLGVLALIEFLVIYITSL